MANNIKKLTKKDELSNFAFLDAQNLYHGIKSQNWQLDYNKFRQYLKDKYKVTKAFLFIGYLPENADLYRDLQSFGYILIFKEALKIKNKIIKGNVDAELVLEVMIQYDNYQKAVIVSGDGDFGCLIKHLYKQTKLEIVLVPNQNKYSVLIKKTAKEKIDSLGNLRKKIQKNDSTDKDKTFHRTTKS